MKLSSRLLMVIGGNLCEKRKIWVSESHFGEVRGDTQLWSMARWKAQGLLFIRFICTFFAVYHNFRVINWNLYSSAVFTGGRPLCTQILPGRSSSINHSWRQKTRDTGLPEVKTASLCIPLFPNTGVLQTEGQMDEFAVSYIAPCKTSFAEHCNTLNDWCLSFNILI